MMRHGHGLNMISPGTVRLSRLHKRTLYLVCALLLLSGGAWLVFEHFVLVVGDYGPMHHPAQAWILKAHGVLAMLGVWGLGVMWPIHIRKGWAAGRHRRSGGLMFACALVLAVTGLLLYYASSDTLRQWSSLVHWIVGLASAGALLAHAVLVPRHGRSPATFEAPPVPQQPGTPLQTSGPGSR